MKLECRRHIATAGWSHPAGVRGLKLGIEFLISHIFGVAPRRGAWVETLV